MTATSQRARPSSCSALLGIHRRIRSSAFLSSSASRTRPCFFFGDDFHRPIHRLPLDIFIPVHVPVTGKRHGWEPGQTRVPVQLQNTQTIKTPVRFFTAARVYSKGRFRGTFTCSGDNPLLKVAHHSNDIAHSPKLNKPSITNPGRPLTPLRKRRVGVPKVASSITMVPTLGVVRSHSLRRFQLHYC